jgi:hypothetical protein
VHFFKTFFMNALATDDGKYNYKKVRRWTTEKRLKGYSLLDCEKVVIPIHQGVHWVLGVINIKGKSLHFFDSMGGSDQDAMVRPGRCCSCAALPWLCCSSAALPWRCRSSATLPWLRCSPPQPSPGSLPLLRSPPLTLLAQYERLKESPRTPLRDHIGQAEEVPSFVYTWTLT